MWVFGFVISAGLLVLFLPFSVGPKKIEGVVVKVDYGNGVQKKFWGSSNQSRSAWDTLQQASAHSFLQVDVAEDFYPVSIDQMENEESGKQWTLYVNNQRIFSSPIEVQINSGDEVLWKFE